MLCYRKIELKPENRKQVRKPKIRKIYKVTRSLNVVSTIPFLRFMKMLIVSTNIVQTSLNDHACYAILELLNPTSTL